MLPEPQHAAPRDGTSVAELQRITALTFVATEPLGSPAVGGTVRDEHERAAELLLARTGEPGPEPTAAGAAGPEPGPVPTAAGALGEGAPLSDRAAVEAGALLLSELERRHAVAS